MKKRSLTITIIAAAVIVLIVAIVLIYVSKDVHPVYDDLERVESDTISLYGLQFIETDYVLESGKIGQGESLSKLLSKYGVGALAVDKIAKASNGIFDLKTIRAGNNYTVFLTADSLNMVDHFVYEKSISDYVTFSLREGVNKDSIVVRELTKHVEVERKQGEGIITSSLWNAMIDAKMSPALAMELSDVFMWSVDFFALRKGDHFKVIYDQRHIDGEPVGVGRIWGAIFNHAGKDYYAIPYKQDGRVTYWDEKGNSLHKTFLKAPLRYSRISSRFSYSRLHPVHRIRRPHLGVDYAAPAGTPVHSVADGTITFRGWDSKGGGNVIKIKHVNSMSTGYLHLRGFAKGISVGKHVSQGELIGYVGSTGVSTGPHLDYRVWQNGKAIDPLKVTSDPVAPITKENFPKYNFVRDCILAELEGRLVDSLKIRQLDSIVIKNLYYLYYPIDTDPLTIPPLDSDPTQRDSADSAPLNNASATLDSTKLTAVQR